MIDPDTIRRIAGDAVVENPLPRSLSDADAVTRRVVERRAAQQGSTPDAVWAEAVAASLDTFDAVAVARAARRR